MGARQIPCNVHKVLKGKLQDLQGNVAILPWLGFPRDRCFSLVYPAETTERMDGSCQSRRNSQSFQNCFDMKI